VELEKARAIAEELKALLQPSCHRIEIAGSIRRQKPEVGDIELLCIPKLVDGVNLLDRKIIDLVAQGILGFRRNKQGSPVCGPKNKLMLHVTSSIGVTIFAETKFSRYSNLFIDWLVNRLENCCNDGIYCDHCPVAAECIACWDTFCNHSIVDENYYSELAARLDELRNRKHKLADNALGKADSIGFRPALLLKGGGKG